MAYSQTKKDTVDRKVQALKAQLYGKDVAKVRTQGSKQVTPDTFQYTTQTAINKSPNISFINPTEVTFLKKDLVKILLIASFAFGVQFILYFGLKIGLVKF